MEKPEGHGNLFSVGFAPEKMQNLTEKAQNLTSGRFSLGALLINFWNMLEISTLLSGFGKKYQCAYLWSHQATLCWLHLFCDLVNFLRRIAIVAISNL